MREILFKAKSLETGEWVEGYLYVRKDGVAEISYYNKQWDVERYTHEVDKNTICQFTGLIDKNGNKIWENDIVDTHNRGVGYSRLEKVIYENGGFSPISTHGWECEPDADEIEVIGNVFDNAELLEE